jgi:hypothetical protein
MLSLLSRFSAIVGTLFLLCSEVAGAADSVVLVGVGQIGTWFTEVTGSNPSDSSLDAQAYFEPHFEPLGPCPALCPLVYFVLDPNGAQTLDPTRFGHFAAGDAVTTVYVTPEEGRPLPSIRARVVNAARPEQAISVPAFRLSTLLALNPLSLSFPGATRSATARTNLVLADLREPNGSQGTGLSVLAEVYGSGGQKLSSGSYTLQPGETRFLVDILGQLGVESLGAGQVRVQKTAGEGHLWGTMFTTDSDGTLTVSVGAHP